MTLYSKYGIGKIVEATPPGKSRCLDGTYSTFGSGGGRCSYHGGVATIKRSIPKKSRKVEKKVLSGERKEEIISSLLSGCRIYSLGIGSGGYLFVHFIDCVQLRGKTDYIFKYDDDGGVEVPGSNIFDYVESATIYSNNQPTKTYGKHYKSDYRSLIPAIEAEKDHIGTWYRNLKINKYTIDFDYEGYKAMDSALKADLKKFFRWNRFTKQWNSKATLDGMNFMAKKILESLPIKFGGTIGERDFKKELENKKSNTEYFDQVGNEFIDAYRNLFSDKFNRAYSSSAGFLERDLNKEMIVAVERKIEEVQQRYNFAEINQIPDYLVKAINRYIDGYMKYLEKKANISIYAPNWMVTGRSNYPVHRLEKARARTGNNFKFLDEINDKFQKALSRYEKSRPSSFTKPYLSNKLLGLQKQIKMIQKRLEDQNNQGASRLELEGQEKYVKDQIEYYGKILYGDKGGIEYDKTRLIAENAKNIKYRGSWYPIKRLNQKTVTISNWLGVPTMEWKVPYVEVAEHK